MYQQGLIIVSPCCMLGSSITKTIPGGGVVGGGEVAGANNVKKQINYYSAIIIVKLTSNVSSDGGSDSCSIS